MDTLQITTQAASRIEELLAAKNWSRAELGRQTGIDPPHISRLMKAEKPTSLDTLTKVATALGVHVADLIRPEPKKGNVPLIPLAPPKDGGLALPFIGHVQAGGGVDDPAEADASSTVSVADTFRGASGVYRVRGKSMLGANIQEGDELIVQLNPDPPSGELVVAWRKDKGATVKRFYRDRHERYMRSESTPGEEDEGVYTLGDGDRIIGVVLGIQRRYTTAPPPKAKPPAKKKGK